ncbi:type I iterative PKS [Penicillium sp. DV-2018c]|nr:type I iterative PKS [Penicillium sp. DV-2018c]
MKENSQWQEPIAIVGMACRLPGGINKPQDLWDHIVQGLSSDGDVPLERFDAENFLSMDPDRPGKAAVSRGHFLDRNLGDFDHRFFGISKDDAMAMDPQQKQLLEVVYECLESAGISTAHVRGANIGCYCGMFTSDYHDIQMRDPENLPTYMSIGTARSMLANRISYVFDFRGPSITFDTACSTSLVALHVACQAIHSGDCDGAIIGATNLFINPEFALAMSRFGVLAEDGLTKTFDADAHGYARGEAINAVYIKRLSDALDDGDNIRGVIRATWSNSDGATSAITVPSHEAQADGIRKAYSLAGIDDFDQTGYFECHGTGTPTGDPIEVSAVSSVFAPNRKSTEPLWIGSTKPNLGHSEAASGLTSLIKVILAMENETIPPNINFDEPNPKIDFERWKVRVPTSAQPWPKKCTQRASINSFGIGGSNAHVIIESQKEYGSFSDHAQTEGRQTNQFFLILVTGNSVHSLEMNISNLCIALQQPAYGTIPLCQLSQEINTRSQPRNRLFKSYFTVKSTKELVEALQGYHYERQQYQQKHIKPRLLFTFTGQGAFWSQMGKVLMDQFTVAEETLRQLDRVISGLQSDKATRWSLIDKLATPLSSTEIRSAALAQPLCTAVQIALVDVLASWGAHPDGVVGHSSGEIAAAYACGAVSAIDAIKIAYYRGIALDSAPEGGMMAVSCNADCKELKDILSQADVSIACINSSDNITISGSVEGIQGAFVKLRDMGISCKVLPVTRAYHTGAMDGLASNYFNMLQCFLRPKNAKLPMYSSVSGMKVDGTDLDARYWETNLRTPVQYSKAVNLALTSMPTLDAFIEIGPHRLLSRPTQKIHQEFDPSGVRYPYFSTMIRDSDTSYQLMKLAGDLVVLGVDVNLREVNGRVVSGRRTSPSNKYLINLPSYAWDYSSKTWSEPRQSLEWRLRQAPRHELLGSLIPGGNPLAPTWRNIISQRELPWVIDHQVSDNQRFPFPLIFPIDKIQINGVATLPISAYVAMIVEALMQLRERNWQGNWNQSRSEFKIENLILSRSIILPDDAPVETFVSLNPSQVSRSRVLSVDFNVVSRRQDIMTSHCQGKAYIVKVDDLETTRETQRLPRSDLPLSIPVESFYKSLERVGHGYGPKFRLLSEVRVRPGSTCCAATLKTPSQDTPRQRYVVHPISLDTALQTLVLSQSAGLYQEFQTTILPSHINSITISVPLEGSFSSCVTETQPSGFGHITGTIECLDALGKRFLSIHGLQMNHVMKEANTSMPWLRLVWRPDIDDAIRNGSTSWCFAKSESSTKQAIHDLEDLIGKLIVLIDDDDIQVSENASPHMHFYRSWLRHHAEYYRTMKSEHENPQCSRRLDTSTISQLVSNDKHLDSVGTQLASRLALNMKQIFAGQVDSLAVMLEDDLLHRLYENSFMVDNMNRKLRAVAELLAHKNPNMKILEIGAGTGGATDQVLHGFLQVGGRASYQSYTFTDISPWFFDKAKKKFAGFERMTFKALDIEKSPTEQGFTDKYHLIVASNVLHVASDMEETMKNVRSMLEDGGHLLLAELSGDLLAPGFIMGSLPGWWQRSQNPTKSGPGLTHEEWKCLLSASWFSDPVDLTAHASTGSPEDMDYTSVMVANAIPIEPPREVYPKAAHVYITGPGSSAKIQRSLEDKLSIHGIDATFQSLAVLSSQPRPGEWLILFDTVGDSILSSLQTKELEKLKLWLDEPINCLWITRNVHLNPQNAAGGLVMGFARTLRHENEGLQFYTLDFSSDDSETVTSIIEHIVSRSSKSGNERSLPVDYELAERDGQLWTCRLQPDPSQRAFGLTRQIDQPISHIMRSPYLLTVQEPGVIDSLIFASYDDPCATMTSEDLLIEVKAVGLDTEDMQSFWGKSENRFFGREFAGVVKQCGSHTTGFQPGDHVVGLGEGTFRTQLLASSVCCRKVSSTIPFEAICGDHPDLLHHGLRILVLNGSTSLGIAVMQLATLFGAEVATIIPDEKHKHLPEKCGVAPGNIFVIPETRIYLQEDVMEREPYGVIVEPVSHKAKVYAGLLVPGGKYIEIGHNKASGDLTNGEARPSNITFTNLDIMDLYRHNKRQLGRILDQIMSYVENEELKSIIPLAVAELQDLKSAFSGMTNGSYEKQVVKLSSSENQSIIRTQQKPHRLNADKTYIITGGLGGLGREISVWLANRGARRLVLLTSSPTRAAGAKDFLQELAAYGCEARVAVCDVAELADVSRVIASIKTPVGGIVHSALRLSDRTFTNMTLDDFKTVLDPKLQGCVNLHKALRNESLDFFVMLSSCCGIVGSPGQANYSASSTFLDSFARYRCHLGLPAASIDLGYVEEVGYVGEHPDIESRLLATGIKPISLKDVVDILEAAILTRPRTLHDPSGTSQDDAYAHSQFIMGFSSIDKLTSGSQTWAKDKKFDPLRSMDSDIESHKALLEEGESAIQTATKKYHDAIRRQSESPSGKDEAVLQPIICSLLMAKMAQVLAIDVGEIGAMQSAAEYGIDSLMAIEVRSWARTIFSVDLPVNELMSPYSIHDLAGKVVRKVSQS